MTGSYTRWIFLCVSFVLAAGLAAAAAPPPDPAWYSKKATWQETVQSAREALARQEAQEDQKTGTVRPAIVLGQWYHIGPFQAKKGFAEAFPPEKRVELDQAYGEFRWKVRPDWDDGQVHELQTPGQSATYLFRTITCDKATKLSAGFGSDDGIAVWLNGKPIHVKDVPRGVQANSDMLTLDLAQGRNELLVKIFNQTGGCGFFFDTHEPGKLPNRADPRRKLRDDLWGLVLRDFSDATAIGQINWERQDAIWQADCAPGDWAGLAQRYVKACRGGRTSAAVALAAGVKDGAGLAKVREFYYESRRIDDAVGALKGFNFAPVRLAITDLVQTFAGRYPKGQAYLDELEKLEKQVAAASAAGAKADNDALIRIAVRLKALREEALLANPLLGPASAGGLDKLLLIRRKANNLGLPQNWQGNCALPRNGYDNELVVMSPVGPAGRLSTVYRPEGGRFIGDVDLHWQGDKLLFSSTDSKGRWQIYELALGGGNAPSTQPAQPRQVTAPDPADVDNYDACYLPNGKVMYDSTACFHGVPCVGGGNQVANLFLAEADGSNARQLCFDQDHNWCPTLLNNGQVMYTRWEYSDSPHYFTRLLMSMNPDGTQQMELYGSNSYWPNSIFYARPIPNHPTQVVAVISGHHGVPRMGELIVFDPARGRHEAAGVVQRIPGYGQKVEPRIADGLVEGSWPKFLHPFPLSDKYFLVSCKPTAQANWGLYLVDIFDNMLLLHEEDGYAMLEPVPLRPTQCPPVIPEKVDLKRKDAIVYLNDVYRGQGLAGVPRGTVKSLRVYEFHFAYNQMGGHINVGIDGPWDVHRIVGTVPVGSDGSAIFRVPANTPIAVQPLDGEGKALQVMRSWLTAMPGEVLSCVGCHERQTTTVANASRSTASVAEPMEVQPWFGPTRGFSFLREVQPVLDKYCVGCHDGKPRNGRDLPDLRVDGTAKFQNFTPSYVALHPYVRRPGPESDYHVQPALEFHADTSELIQMLRKGHNGVKLDAEAWDRLVTWIDLNVPDKGTWGEHRAIAGKFHERRLEMRKRYAGISEDPEQIVQAAAPGKVAFVQPPAIPPAPPAPQVPGWPFDAAGARKMQNQAAAAIAAVLPVGGAANQPPTRTIELATGLKLELVLIPAGEFVMGDVDGCLDERPACKVRIDKPFWMGRFEITNAQYALFDDLHDSGVMSTFKKDHGHRGEMLNRSTQPAVHVSWERAVEFCRWLSQKTGTSFGLPGEAQWEWACRGGTATPMNYGSTDLDFGKLANLADQRLNNLAGGAPIWIPAVMAVNDGSIVTDNVGKYAPNAFGLQDMHGNAAEWTLSLYKPYPYDDSDGRNRLDAAGRRVVRGGSFYDRPQRCRSGFRLDYEPWHGPYNVGFRVICPAESKSVVMK